MTSGPLKPEGVLTASAALGPWTTMPSTHKTTHVAVQLSPVRSPPKARWSQAHTAGRGCAASSEAGFGSSSALTHALLPAARDPPGASWRGPPPALRLTTVKRGPEKPSRSSPPLASAGREPFQKVTSAVLPPPCGRVSLGPRGRRTPGAAAPAVGLPCALGSGPPTPLSSGPAGPKSAAVRTGVPRPRDGEWAAGSPLPSVPQAPCPFSRVHF